MKGDGEVTDRFFELLGVAVGTRESLVQTPTAEQWQSMYDMAKRQALIGVCGDGVARLPEHQRPPRSLVMSWAMSTLRIERENRDLNRRAVEVQQKFRARSFRSCIFKGQGVAAAYYPKPLHRQSGDIDLWLEGGRRRIVDFVRSVSPRETVSYHHIDFSVMRDCVVELHFFPSFLTNPICNRRMMNYWRRHEVQQMEHEVALPEDAGVITAPTDQINVVALLAHIMHHYFEEGVGLRQIVDYYYLLVNGTFDRAEAVRQLHRFHMTQFAGAVMYVMQRVLCMDEKHMLVKPDVRRGVMLLESILEGGNFGAFNEHVKNIYKGRSPLGHFVRRERYNMRMLASYPEVFVSEIGYRVFYYFYRLYWNKIKPRR